MLSNSFLLSLNWDKDAPKMSQNSTVINHIDENAGGEAKILALGSCLFSFIFIIEVVIKLIGMGWKGMCQSYRNCYDLLITSLSIPWARLSCCLLLKRELFGDHDKAFHVFYFLHQRRIDWKNVHLWSYSNSDAFFLHLWQTCKQKYQSFVFSILIPI